MTLPILVILALVWLWFCYKIFVWSLNSKSVSKEMNRIIHPNISGDDESISDPIFEETKSEKI